MFVGIIEFMLEFVRPLTLSMRLFGNIYGGEVALGVITALTVVILPVLLLGLEFMLNLIQALIFSILTLMFIVLAIESHHEERGTWPKRRRTSSRATGADARTSRRPGHQPCEFNGPRQSTARSNQSLTSLPGRQRRHMEHIGAGLAAMGVIGPGIGIGILGGSPRARSAAILTPAGQIRGLAIILAGFAEGLGVLAIVVGLLTIFIK